MAKKRKRMKSKKAYKVKLKPATVFSIVQITFFTLALLVIVSFLRQGLILVRLNDLLTTYFSWTAVFLSFIFFLPSFFSWTAVFLSFIFLTFGFSVSKFRTPLGSHNVIIGTLIFFVSILTLTRPV